MNLTNRILRKLEKIAINCATYIILTAARIASVDLFLIARICKLPLFIFFCLLGDKVYIFLALAKNKNVKTPKRLSAGKGSKSSQSKLRMFMAQVLMGNSNATPENYRSHLVKAQPSAKTNFDALSLLINAGRLDLAREAALDLDNGKQHELPLEERLQFYRSAGTVSFLLGKNQEANRFWRIAGKLRNKLFYPTTPKKYRILGSSWFAAVGHVAMLDYYLKYKRLYGQADHRIVVTSFPNLGCSHYLLLKFAELGISIIKSDELESDYDQWATKNGAIKWQQLLSSERAALIDDFWEHEFPDGEILSYTHAASRIQREWEQAGNLPLLAISKAEQAWLDDFLLELGVPANAWYVCLHVRESGFHKSWNSKYPTMRDSEISDYYLAIQEIVNAGGWVIRMGDSSMKKLPSMPQVIDYAHNNTKQPLADVLLAASCRFFLGTNSGFATIPAIYGIPCALSNWVPIGWPLWPSQDLMICKLFRDKHSQRYLSLKEIFTRGLAFLQNWSDLPQDIELVANSSEDIRQLTLEMLSHVDPTKQSLNEAGAPMDIQTSYIKLAADYEAFVGSRWARSFVANYPEVFIFDELKDVKNNHEIIEQLQEHVVLR